MKIYSLAVLALTLSAPLFGQGAKLNIQLDHLAAKAESVVNVNMDRATIEMGRQALSTKKELDPEVKQLMEGLEGIYVRVFEFANPGVYTQADVEEIRKQLSGPGWASFVDVREKGETVSVYSYVEGGKVGGMAVLAAEPKELVVVNIVGPIDLAKLGKLSGQLGIPEMKSIMKPGAGKQKPKREDN